MKCPMRDFITGEGPGGVRVSGEDCIKEECAWWDSEQQKCDPSGLVHWVRALIAELWAIKEKMPHAGQFRDR